MTENEWLWPWPPIPQRKRRAWSELRGSAEEKWASWGMRQRRVLMTTSESRGSFPLAAIQMCTVASSAICRWPGMGTPKYSITQLTFLLSLPLVHFSLPHILSRLGVKRKEEEMPSHHLLAGGSVKWPKDNCYLSDTGHTVREMVAFSLIYLSTYVSVNRF